VILFGYWIHGRSVKENVTANNAAQAMQADSTNGTNQQVAGQSDLRKGIDQNADTTSTEDTFVKIVKDSDTKTARQEEAKRLATEKDKADAVDKARREEAAKYAGKGGAPAQPGQPGQPGYPGSVGPDGTAANGSHVMTPQEAEAARQAQQNGVRIMPEAQIDPSLWIDTPKGRVRPSYQVHRRYPVSEEDNKALDKVYWQSYYSPMVVGLGDKQNAAMARVQQDMAGVSGGFGVKRQDYGVHLSSAAKLPIAPHPRADGGTSFGNWIKIEPADQK
jgi:hypothetical protein